MIMSYEKVVIVTGSGNPVTIPQLAGSAADCTIIATPNSVGTFVDRANGVVDFAPPLPMFQQSTVTATQSTQWPDGNGEFQSANITSQQVAQIDKNKSNIEQLSTDLNSKVDRVVGKGLSTNDLTDALVLEIAKIVDKADQSDLSQLAQNVTNALASKVDIEVGKGLSTNDLTDLLLAEINKVADKADQSALTQLAQDLTTALQGKVSTEVGKGLSSNDLTNALVGEINKVANKLDTSAHIEFSNSVTTALSGKASNSALAVVEQKLNELEQDTGSTALPIYTLGVNMFAKYLSGTINEGSDRITIADGGVASGVYLIKLDAACDYPLVLWSGSGAVPTTTSELPDGQRIAEFTTFKDGGNTPKVINRDIELVIPDNIDWIVMGTTVYSRRAISGNFSMRKIADLT